jgi:preprotein translocase subunit SecG
MILLLFVVHVFIAIALVGVVLLQKSEGGALGMGGGGMSGFMTGRSTANLLTRTTAVLAALFFLTSIALVMLSNAGRAPRSSMKRRRVPWRRWRRRRPRHRCPRFRGHRRRLCQRSLPRRSPDNRAAIRRIAFFGAEMPG